ncbi:MAG: NADH-quinone oxidoreductase subunit J [Propionibacteriaceae bacterium]|jgi:NADH-quinone oxidoreductase subunit J|nr:NADH-quinone oxidoreductase subunit J [Propionibacteriaceae bacterium]
MTETLEITPQLVGIILCGALAIIGGIGLITLRKAVHAALSLAFVMVNLAVIYALFDAALLAAAQVIVYTGAILMLFLFVIMLVGVDRTESHREPIRGLKPTAIVAGIGLCALIILGVGSALTATPVGLESANATWGGNVESLAVLIFQSYVFPFEYISALMIIAPVGAMVLAHGARLRPKRTQADRAAERIAAYAKSGAHPGPLPNAAVTALHDSIATPALLPDGSISAASVAEAMVERDAVVNTQWVAARTAERFAELNGEVEPAVVTPEPLELIDTDEERGALK